MSLQDDMKSAVTRLLADMSLFYDIMHSGPTVNLVIDGQTIPSLRKLFTDLQLNVPAITNTLADHETRLRNAEAVLGTGANTNLLNDVANVRNTRVWPRPGEAIGTWTAATDAAPSAAASLVNESTINGVGYRINNAIGGGKALQITGAGAAGPIGLDRLDPEDIATYRFVLSRETDAATDILNTPSIALEAFSFTGSYLGRVQFTTQAKPEDMPTSVASITFIGDSITVGRNASSDPKEFANALVADLGASKSYNGGASGTVLQNSNDASGAPRAKNGRDRYTAVFGGANKSEMAVIAYGFNDARYTAAPSTFNVNQFKNDYREIINGLLALGYALNRIVLVTPHYITDVGLQTGSTGFKGQTRSGFEAYVQATKDVAGEFGVYIADSYSRMRDNGGASLISGDNIHPNDAGHAAILGAIKAATRQPLQSALIKSQGARIFEASVSRRSGLGDFDLPTGTIYVRARAGNAGGSLNVISAGRLSGSQTLVQQILAGEQRTLILDDDRFGFGSGNGSAWTTFADLVAAFRGKLDPVVYTDTFNLTVDTVSKILMPEDPDLIDISWQAPGYSVAFCHTGEAATLGMTTPSIIAYDGGGGFKKFGEEGAAKPMSFVADRAGKITVSTTRKTPGRPTANLFADNLMSYWPDQDVNPQFRSAMRTALNGAQNDGLLKALWFMYLCGHSEPNDAINLMNPILGKTLTYNRGTNGLVTTPYGWVQGAGDGWIETGLTVDDLRIGPNDYMLAVAPGSTQIDAAGIMLAISASYYVTPQITSTKARAKSAASGVDDFNAAPGSWVGMARRNPGSYDQYVNGDLVADFVRQATAGTPTSTLKLLAQPVAGGVSAQSRIPLRLAFAGQSYNTAASYKKLYDWFAPVLAVCDDIRAGNA